MRRFRKEFGLKKARILRERLIPVSQRLKIGINRHPPHVYDVSTRKLMLVDFSLDVSRVEEMVSQGAAGLS